MRYSVDELAAMATGDSSGRDWAADYPTEGELRLLGLGLLDAEPAHADAPFWGPLQVRERATGRAIGGAGFKAPPDEMNCVEIGYGLVPDARGRGYATEAVLGLVAAAGRAGATYVSAQTLPGNTASERVLVKAGFSIVGSDADANYWRRDAAIVAST